jgi:type I restriction enzyme, S subunit
MEIELPKHWKIVRLGDYAKTEKGKKPKSISKERTKEFSVPYVNIKAFEQNIIDEYTNGVGCVLCDDDDFLMVWDGSRSGYVGKAIKGALGSTLVKIKLPDVDHDFAYYFLQSKFREINSRVKGVGIPHVDPNIVWNYKFPLPPKEVQQQIVSKIEELFSELDKGIEEIKIAQQQLKVYRQAVLKWAFEGKLTNKDVKEGGLPLGWKSLNLKDMSENIQYGYTASSSKQAIGPKFLRITDIQDNKVNWTEVPYCKIDDESKNKYLLREGDLVFARTGATVGKSFLIKGEIPEAVFASYLIRVRVNQTMNEKYLSYFFHSNNYWSQITEGQVGIGQPNVNGTKLGQLKIVVAPIEKQQQIVQEIESRLSVCDKIEETISNSLKQAEALRQSILKKAFEGKLI